jgi:hypothetical protein
MAIAMPPSVIVLIVAPPARRTQIVVKSEIGMASRVIRLARAGEEHHDHQQHHQAALDQGRGRVGDRVLDEGRLAEEVAVEVHALGQGGPEFLQHPVQLAGELEGVGLGLLLDGQDHPGLDDRLPVGTARRGGGGAAPDGRADLDHAEVADGDRSTAAQGDEGSGDVVGVLDAPDPAQDGLRPRVDHESGGHVLVRLREGLAHLPQAEPEGLQLEGREDDLELLLLAADGRDLRDPGHREQAPAHQRAGSGAQGHRVVTVGDQGQEQDLAHDRGDRRQHRRLDLRRQGAGDGRQALGDRLARALDVGAPLELHPHDRGPHGGRRAHAAYVQGPVHGRLDREGDQGLHLLGGHSVALDDDGDRRRGEIGEDVDRHAHRRKRAHPQQE